jgi:signal transduction histidine kinase
MFDLFSIFKKKGGEPVDRIKNFELEAIMENIRDGVIVYDANFTILSMNRSALSIVNLNAEEVLGKTIGPDLIKNPHLRVLTEIIFPSLAPAMTTVSASGWPQIIDITLEDPHLELRTVLNRIVNEKGEMVGFLKLVTDTTREKKVVESKNEFISVAAHQLRTPLTAINWSFESLNKILGEKSPDMKEAANLTKEGWQLTERSLKIVNDLLNAARIEEGRFGFKLGETDLTEFIQIILKQAEPSARGYGIKVSFVPPTEKFRVRIDQELLGMAIVNIIDNAIKYNTKNGEVIVEAAPDADPRFVKLAVRDTGVGIPKEDLEKMFQKFYRGGNVVQMEPNGSGLGLYITKNIIEGHGGKAKIESQPGRGTVFSFTLPLDFSLIPNDNTGN